VAEPLLFVAVALLSAFVHGAFGFGFPLLATPLLALVFDLRTAILLTLVPTVSINLVSILSERHWRSALRRYWPIPAFTIIGSVIGTKILLVADPEPFRLLLALVLIAYLVSDRLHRGQRPIEVGAIGQALFGLVLGLLAGVINIFAPLVVVFALYTQMPTALMVATFNLSFITSKSGQIIGFVTAGAFDFATVHIAVYALPAILAALWLGIRLRRSVATDDYRRMLRGALWIIALLVLGDAAWRLIATAGGWDGADMLAAVNHPGCGATA
jgi:uncharacterized membrane protein YfcA